MSPAQREAMWAAIAAELVITASWRSAPGWMVALGGKIARGVVELGVRRIIKKKSDDRGEFDSAIEKGGLNDDGRHRTEFDLTNLQ